MKSELLIAELRHHILANRWNEKLPIEGLHIGCVDTQNDPSSSIASPMLALVAQGTKRIVFDNRAYDYGSGDFLVVSVDLPVTGQFIGVSKESPFLGLGLDLRPDVIASLLTEGQHQLPERSPVGLSPLGVGQASEELLDAAVRLVRLLDRPDDVPVLAPMIIREITWRLLTSEMGAVVRQLGLADSSFSQVGRAIRWIREHPSAAFRVDDLADTASMSVSTFHRHFRSVTTMSPVQFQKKVRLQQARLLLVGEGIDVASVGFTVGYDNPSQFSREYRREFGAPPGQDATRLRAEPAPWQLQDLP